MCILDYLDWNIAYSKWTGLTNKQQMQEYCVSGNSDPIQPLFVV